MPNYFQIGPVFLTRFLSVRSLSILILVFLANRTLHGLENCTLDIGFPRIMPMKLCDSTSSSLGDVIKSSLMTDGRRCILTTDIRR